MKKFVQVLLFCFLIIFHIVSEIQAQSVSLSLIGTYKTGVYDNGAAEISAYDPGTRRLFVVNGDSATIDVLNISDPYNPTLAFKIPITPYGGGVNSVYAKNGIIAAAVEADPKQDNGSIVFFDANGIFLKQVIAGALPDNIVWSPDGKYVLTANEGEPNSDYSVDPLGSVTIVDVSGGVAGLTQANVTTLDFTSFNNAALDTSIRIFGPNATVAMDLEPEYVAISPDSRTAWVTLQEANAIATIDIINKSILGLKGLGFKDHSLPQNKLDASDRDGGINIRNWPIYGVYMPDEMAAYSYNGSTYLVMANEGDSREYDTYEEEIKATEQSLDSTIFPKSDSLWLDKNLGRLKFSRAQGVNDTIITTLYSWGARSFTIRDSIGNIIFDSGDQFEQYLSTSQYAANFNASNTSNSLDNRSDDKGPEPEGINVSRIGDSVYAFIGLERMSGIMVYNVTNPNSPHFVQYASNRNFSISPGAANVNTIGDLGPEGLIFIPAAQSPIYRNLLVVSNEISGTVSIYTTDDLVVPVELASFSANVIDDKIILGWRTASEVNNKGFEIEKSTGNSEFVKLDFVEGNGTTTEQTIYSFTDNSADKNSIYKYRLKQLDYNGNFSYSNVIEVNLNNINNYGLSQNYPNPFNPSTKISFTLPVKESVEINLYNILGKHIKTLASTVYEAGVHELTVELNNLAAGVYFYSIKTSNFHQTRKLMLVK